MKNQYIEKMETSGGMIRCAECGHKNSPVYHYCGVCGAVLRAAEPKPPAAAPPVQPPAPVPPAPVAPAPIVSTPVVSAPVVIEPLPPPPAPPVVAQPEPVPVATPRAAVPPPSDIPVTGMSFLGLSTQPDSTAEYLLDDEGEPSHTGRYIFLLLLLAVIGGLGWQWHQRGFPFNQAQSNAAVTQPAVTPPASTQPETTTPPATESATPAPPAENTAQPAEPAKTEATPPPAEAKTEPAATAAATPPKAEPEPQKPEPQQAEPPKEVATATPPKKPVKTPAPKPAAPAETPMAAAEALFVQGQRYLYGSSEAPEDCDKALKSFLAAASRQHSRAESTLGTMYFTGHCVKKDLPTAYRWFAKALRQDPTNTRLEQNLSVVWREMSPEERQSATRAE